jgi:glucose 1-dehydrogenase
VKAMTVVPGKLDSADVEEVPEPPESDGSILVTGLFVGICGTDVEIAKEGYGWVPPGQQKLILFHESLGRVEEAPAGSGFATGDLVVGIVRRPDPVPCAPCGHGQWDFCNNGQYTERGIKERNGYGSERWRIEPEYAIKLDPRLGDLGVLLEPTTVVAKAWAQVDAALARVYDPPQRVLVTGAGPIGLLAALIGRQRGLEVHVVDRVTDGPKPQLVADIGATYHSTPVHELGLTFDVIIEATGVGQVVFDAMTMTMPNAVVVLTGISSGTRTIEAKVDAFNKSMVLTNEVVVGSVNAGRKDYESGAEVLAAADPAWLSRLISRKVPMADWPQGLLRQDDDVKVVVQIAAS